jgi:23S rRNA-/tRNA-specific pseudouridylate synthase/SAM-dependent methyltransferase
VLVVDKPVGLVSADPARAAGGEHLSPAARPGHTLFEVLKKFVRERAFGARRGPPPRLWIVHRLDKEASGLMVFAKSEGAFASLKDQFKTKAAQRIYLAVTEGELGPPGHTGTHQSMLEDQSPPPGPGPGRGDKHRPQRSFTPGSERALRPAVTHYRVVETARGRSLVQVRLETGRKNQIRIHMSELGKPLVGDARFGAKTDPIGRLGLHAAELGFEHPGTHKPVRYRSSAPASFYTCVGLPPPAGSEEGGAERAPAAAPTSWNNVAGWYDSMLEEARNDHYEDVILPRTLELLAPRAGERVIDVACGQGIVSRKLAEVGCEVVGVDAAPALVEAARARSEGAAGIRFEVGDARDLRPLGEQLGAFDAAVCVMALANIDPVEPVLEGIGALLKPGGRLVAVITHPGFRGHGQTYWGWDDERKRQFRRVDAYLSRWSHEVQMHPGKAAAGESGGEQTTWSFHRPIGAYVEACTRAGLLVEALGEWTSVRTSTSGPRAEEENRSRREIPMFLAIRAVKRGG